MLNNKSSLFIFSVCLLLFPVFLISCNSGNPKNAAATNSSPPQVKKGIAPVADSEIAVVETDYGTIKIELYSNIAPKMVARFKELAREGIYSGTTFHRVNENVIQSGDPLSKDDNPLNDGMGKSDKPNVDAEFSDIPYDTGIVGAARGQEANTANSQFFIMLKRQPDFDTRYTVFGKVIEGMSNVQTIGGAPKQGEKPLEAIRIKSVSIQPK
ncbi:MAG TPA: peptidylprolyl isomerase [Pyrinomonadaceae bacterium]|jgi:cyclophilin family peptidyl-prolyl cis-trans isomerase